MQPDASISQTPLRIVLVGFMGAGKSTVGARLASRLGWRFADADQYLQAKTGSTIAEIFSAQHEAGFRRLEAEAIAELHRERDLVIALGGGALETGSTRVLLAKAEDTCVIFLKAPLEVLIARCESQPGAAVRPILQQRELLSHRYHSRMEHYEQARLHVATEGLEPEAVVDRIVEQLREQRLLLSPIQKALSPTQKAVTT